MTLRILCGILFLILSGSIIWAFKSAPFWASFDLITENPWGKVTLIDLYSGFVAFAIVIGLVDGLWVGLIAFLLLCVLGNVVSLAWLALHGFALLWNLIDKSLSTGQ
jgi:hypothetical protein